MPADRQGWVQAWLAGSPCSIRNSQLAVKWVQATADWLFLFRSAQFSRSVMSYTLWTHGLQHARPPCLPPTPGVYSNLGPSSQWFHPTISSSVDPFSSHLQYFPAPGSFPMSQSFASGSQSVGVSPSTSVLPINIQDWFPLDGLVGLPWSPRDSQESSPTPQFKSIDSLAFIFMVQLSHPYMTTGKTIALTIQTIVSKVTPLHFNMLSRLVITFLPRSKHLLISRLQSPSAVILEPKK